MIKISYKNVNYIIHPLAASQHSLVEGSLIRSKKLFHEIQTTNFAALKAEVHADLISKKLKRIN